ncbi:hypothetical protein IAR50_000637 [Cryptococcus sp. DSM 104548]
MLGDNTRLEVTLTTCITFGLGRHSDAISSFLPGTHPTHTLAHELEQVSQPQIPGSSGPVLKRQRLVKSCGFCYRHKVKCDKVFPCSRCTSRGLGHLCEQQTAIVNGQAGESSRGSRKQPTVAELIEENKSLHRKVNAQQKIINSLSGGQAPEDGKGLRAKLFCPESTTSEPQQEAAEPDAERAEQPDYLFTIREVYGTAPGSILEATKQPVALSSQSSASLGNVVFEMGKRIWTCLEAAHCMHPSISQPYALSYPASRTSPPANVDDTQSSDTVPVIPQPLSQTTGITHLIAMGQFANL